MKAIGDGKDMKERLKTGMEKAMEDVLRGRKQKTKENLKMYGRIMKTTIVDGKEMEERRKTGIRKGSGRCSEMRELGKQIREDFKMYGSIMTIAMGDGKKMMERRKVRMGEGNERC